MQLTKFYQGTIDIVVMWDDGREAAGASFLAGDVAATISGLEDADGVPLTNDDNDVGAS